MAGSIAIALFNPKYGLAIKMGWWFLGLAVVGYLVVIRDLLRK